MSLTARLAALERTHREPELRWLCWEVWPEHIARLAAEAGMSPDTVRARLRAMEADVQQARRICRVAQDEWTDNLLCTVFGYWGMNPWGAEAGVIVEAMRAAGVNVIHRSPAW